MNKLFRLIQFTDTSFPVGAFSFSNGLETASHLGLVHDAETLKQYTWSVARQAAFTEGVIALHAYRHALQNNLPGIINVDKELILFRLNEEGRNMLTRMGKKLAELGLRLYGRDSLFEAWLKEINADQSPGTYPVAQGIAFAIEGMDEKFLFVSHQYGVMNMVLSAALRCVRVSHYDTQQILFELSGRMEELWEHVRHMNFENMNSFVPQMDILASLHEKGKMRMFMN